MSANQFKATTDIAGAPFRLITGESPADEQFRLLTLRYGNGPFTADSNETLTIGMQAYGATDGETFVSPEPVSDGTDDGVRYRHNSQTLLAWVEINETDQSLISDISNEMYRKLLRFQDRQDFSEVLRIWNYFPAINSGLGDHERYRQFCVGRARAMHDAGALERPFPAATCVGTQAGPIVLMWLAAREPGAQIENPRQVSAYHYPPRYGPVSPSFSRATLKHWRNSAHLYISGTASVVGHESRHSGDVVAQLAESLKNVEALLAQATAASPQLDAHSVSDLAQLKVFLRRESDYPAVTAALSERLVGADVPCLYLQADICRQELLLEVEGLCVQHG